MRRIGLLLIGVLCLSLFAYAGEVITNNTGEDATGLRVTFSQPVLITAFGDILTSVDPQTLSFEFVFSGGTVESWGSQWFNYAPATARILNYEWLLQLPAITERSTTDVARPPWVTQWSLGNSIASLPEVRTGAVSDSIEEAYFALLTSLPESTQRWIVGMGWGLEDLVLDPNEAGLLQTLAGMNVATCMHIMTSQWVIDGITPSEVIRASALRVEGLPDLLDHDLDQLVALGLLGTHGVAEVRRLLDMAGADYEMAKGFHLIANFGHPDETMFTYTVPTFNTQLYVLGVLAEKGIPAGYERIALAASLNYGSVCTVSGGALVAETSEYAWELLHFIAKTEEVLWQGKADWSVRDYSLEGSIGLAWSGVPDYYRYTDSEIAFGWENIFAVNPMTAEDFEWLFASIETLKSMREWVFRQVRIEGANPDAVVKSISDSIRASLYLPPSSVSFEIDGRAVGRANILNPDWQWQHFQDSGQFIGACGDFAMLQSLLSRSAGISALPGQVAYGGMVGLGGGQHSFGAYSVPAQDVWKPTYRQGIDLVRVMRQPVNVGREVHYGYNMINWGNVRFAHEHLDNIYKTDWRMYIFITTYDPETYLEGIPTGYIYRFAQAL